MKKPIKKRSVLIATAILLLGVLIPIVCLAGSKISLDEYTYAVDWRCGALSRCIGIKEGKLLYEVAGDTEHDFVQPEQIGCHDRELNLMHKKELTLPSILDENAASMVDCIRLDTAQTISDAAAIRELFAILQQGTVYYDQTAADALKEDCRYVGDSYIDVWYTPYPQVYYSFIVNRYTNGAAATWIRDASKNVDCRVWIQAEAFEAWLGTYRQTEDVG